MKDTLGERPRSAISLNKIIKELRGPDTIRDYVRLMDLLIQGVVSAKVFKDNRETTPMREWVTVSDEAFLLLCVENYATVWENEVRVGADEEIPEGPIPMARYTGKNKGTKKSWSKDGMKLFNHFMERVFLSREDDGEEFDDLFMRAMKEKYNKQAHKKKRTADANVVAAQRKKDFVVLSDFTIQQYMNERRQNRDEPAAASSDSNDDGSSDSNDDGNGESEQDDGDRAGLIEHRASSSEDEEHIPVIAL
jgi:hypothetical protein